jgi:hypothetical protein
VANLALLFLNRWALQGTSAALGWTQPVPVPAMAPAEGCRWTAGQVDQQHVLA